VKGDDDKMRRTLLIALITATSAVAAGCAATPSTAGLATPWAVAGIHSFKPQKEAPQPNAAKVDEQVAQLLDDASEASKDADVRVAAK
jgi:hypothetical protein